jgi:threonine dehydrogenase-like Zn-dependent dehydrogenase
VKAIVNTGPDRLELTEWPTPEPGFGQVRIRTTACAICATDLQMIAGWERTGFPAIPGHEWAGVIEAVGQGVNGAMIGRNCVAENVLQDGGEVGFEHPGGYGECLVTDAANVRPLPSSFDMSAAALIEPLAVCVRALRRLRPQPPSPVLVFGDGPIGLLVTALLARAGRRDVTLAGGRDLRLKLAREFGAAQAVNYHQLKPDLVAGLRPLAPGGFGTIVEASGAAAATAAALELAATGARVLVIGDYGKHRAGFAWNHLLHRELELIGSTASAGAWDEASRLAVSGEAPLARLVTHPLPVARFQEGIELMRHRREDVIKVVLNWA